MEHRNVEFVRKLWAVTHRDGIAAALRTADPATEWSLHFVPARTFDTGELRDFLLKIQGDRQLLAALLLRTRVDGNGVLASGSFRWGSLDGGLSDFQGHWVYEFDDERLVAGWSFSSLSQAEAALAGIGERTRRAFSAD